MKFSTWVENKDVLKFNKRDALKFFGLHANLPKDVEHWVGILIGQKPIEDIRLMIINT